MMDYALDPVGSLKPSHSSRALRAMLGAVAVSAGLRIQLGSRPVLPAGEWSLVSFGL
jgi:hypothetical protein